MFEKELDRVKHSLRQRLDGAQPYTSLQSIIDRSDIHASVRAYLQAEARWWIHEERAIRASNARFDSNAEPLRSALNEVDELLYSCARYDHEELLSTIDSAVKTRLNFLCRPRTTLKWFVFRGEPTKPLYEILLRLDYLTDHAYLLQGIRQWAMSRGAESSANEILSVVEFERIIERIDNEAILDLTEEEFVKLLDGLYGFFAEADPELPPESVPTEAVIIFLDDKGAIPLSQALERMLYREELRTLTRTKLVDVIKGVIASIDAQPPSPFQELGVSAPIADQEPEGIPGDHSPSTDEMHRLRTRVFETSIDPDQRGKILRKVFRGDTEEFDSVVRRLLGCLEWKQAAGMLDRYYAKNGIDPDTSTAMEFAQALHRSYA
ncbi:MAG: hypothetical protein FGM33_09980 [Candidatus Kapabacteria bacterium]|nr:hypothetical protein [Candidatus Kapabacteria bacterium]